MSVVQTSQEPRITRSPQRQYARVAVPIGHVSVRSDLHRVACDVVSRIKEIRRARGQATLVFASVGGDVYATAEESVTADVLTQDNPDFLVGSYAGQTAAGVKWCPSEGQIVDDLRAHFESMGVSVTDRPEQLTLWGWRQERMRRSVMALAACRSVERIRGGAAMQACSRQSKRHFASDT